MLTTQGFGPLKKGAGKKIQGVPIRCCPWPMCLQGNFPETLSVPLSPPQAILMAVPCVVEHLQKGSGSCVSKPL